jgi:outer membrane protein
MKLFVAFLVALSLLSGASAGFAEVKLAYIDSEVLRQKLPEFKKAQQELERLRQAREQEITERRSKLAKIEEDFRKQELLMSEARKAEMRTSFEEKVRELQELNERTFAPGGELFKKNIELSGPIFERIKAALDEIGKEEGYDFIFDISSQSSAIVYVDENKKYNLTDKLLERLKDESQKEEVR